MKSAAERLLNTLWEQKPVLQEFLSLVVLERVALPWRRYNGTNPSWKLECLSILGTPIARLGQIPVKNSPALMVSEIYLPNKPEVEPRTLEEINSWLTQEGWVLISLPVAKPWASTNAGIDQFERRTEQGVLVAQVTSTVDGCTAYIPLLDSTLSLETKSLRRAKITADQHLKDLQFPLEEDTTL